MAEPAAAPPSVLAILGARKRLILITALAIVFLAIVVPIVVRNLLPETLELVGTVERQSLELAAPTAERIVEIQVRPGQQVEAGQILVRLDAEVAELEVEAAGSNLAAAEASLAAARQELARVAGLARAKVVSPQALDNARKAHDEARAMQAERAARTAQARRLLADLTLRTPKAGTVDQIAYEIGERVPSGSVIAVILATGAPWVRVWIPARAVARLRPGSTVEVEIPGIDGSFRGRLDDIAREPEFTPHFALTERERDHLVYESRVVLEDAPASLRPGLPATVRIRLGEPPEAGRS